MLAVQGQGHELGLQEVWPQAESAMSNINAQGVDMTQPMKLVLRDFPEPEPVVAPPLVKVVWLDSGMHIDKGWAPRAEYVKDTALTRMTVTTVGLLMHKDDESVLVGLTYDPSHDTWFGAQLIAVQNISELTYLTEGGTT